MLIIALILAGGSLWALRAESVRWRMAIPFSILPIIMTIFLGPLGIVVGAIYLGSLCKLNLSGL